MLAIAVFRLTVAPDARQNIETAVSHTGIVIAKAEAKSVPVQHSEKAVLADVQIPPPNTPEAWMDAVGIAPEDRDYVNYIMGQESGWCAHKWEGQIGYCPTEYTDRFSPENPNVGYGLCQSTPAIKMASAGDDWQDNPITQLRWCTNYAKGYGGWAQAATFKKCTGWCYSPRAKTTVFKYTPYW